MSRNKSVLNQMDWYQEISDVPMRVIAVPELEQDEYLMDNDFRDTFDTDSFSIWADLWGTSGSFEVASGSFEVDFWGKRLTKNFRCDTLTKSDSKKLKAILERTKANLYDTNRTYTIISVHISYTATNKRNGNNRLQDTIFYYISLYKSISYHHSTRSRNENLVQMRMSIIIIKYH